MYRIFFALFFVMLFAGCMSYPKISTLNTLKPGITKQQLSDHFGGAEPVSSQFIDGHHVLKYKLRDRYDIRHDIGHYFIFDQNDLLVGWKEEPRKQTSGGGVSLLIPVPLRK